MGLGIRYLWTMRGKKKKKNGIMASAFPWTLPGLPALISANAEKLIPSHGKFPQIFFRLSIREEFGPGGRPCALPPSLLVEWKKRLFIKKKGGRGGGEERKSVLLYWFPHNFKALFAFKLYYGSAVRLGTLGWKDCPNSISRESGKKNKRDGPREGENTKTNTWREETSEVWKHMTEIRREVSTDLTLLWGKPAGTAPLEVESAE